MGILVLLWVIYFVLAVFEGGGVLVWLWGLIIASANIIAFLAVLYGMRNKKEIYLLPALFICIIDIIIGLIEGVINFISLSWLNAFWILGIVVVTSYFAIALSNVYDDIENSKIEISEDVQVSVPAMLGGKVEEPTLVVSALAPDGE